MSYVEYTGTTDDRAAEALESELNRGPRRERSAAGSGEVEWEALVRHFRQFRPYGEARESNGKLRLSAHPCAGCGTVDRVGFDPQSGKVLFASHTGCSPQRVRAALGVAWAGVPWLRADVWAAGLSVVELRVLARILRRGTMTEPVRERRARNGKARAGAAKRMGLSASAVYDAITRLVELKLVTATSRTDIEGEGPGAEFKTVRQLRAPTQGHVPGWLDDAGLRPLDVVVALVVGSMQRGVQPRGAAGQIAKIAGTGRNRTAKALDRLETAGIVKLMGSRRSRTSVYAWIGKATHHAPLADSQDGPTPDQASDHAPLADNETAYVAPLADNETAYVAPLAVPEGEQQKEGNRRAH